MKYRKKPVVIEAEQFVPEKMEYKGTSDIPQSIQRFRCGVVGKLNTHNERYYTIQTLEGIHKVTPCDWIITGVKGEKYPCKPDIFEMTYEKV